MHTGGGAREGRVWREQGPRHTPAAAAPAAAPTHGSAAVCVSLTPAVPRWCCTQRTQGHCCLASSLYFIAAHPTGHSGCTSVFTPGSLHQETFESCWLWWVTQQSSGSCHCCGSWLHQLPYPALLLLFLVLRVGAAAAAVQSSLQQTSCCCCRSWRRLHVAHQLSLLLLLPTCAVCCA